jgi:hypothetical protein
MGRNEEMIANCSRKSKLTGKGESIGNQVALCRLCIFCGKRTSGLA